MPGCLRGYTFRETGLKIRYKAKEIASWRSYCVAGKQTSEVNQVEPVVQVFAVGLQSHCKAFSLVEVGAHRSIERKQRPDAVAAKIEAIHNLLTVFLDILLRGLIRFKR